MGATGTGKSSFVRLITGDETIIVGHGLHSSTAKIQEYRVEHEDTSFVLVDTPGFDDTDVPDEIVLQSITEWLTSSHHDGRRLNGILYLHCITDV
ncbi:hypothetical protein AA0112_g5832 [Alternaria arborescens]|nr:hypothetical protein AA0112_g5832 [Alternaria arborescens]